MSSLPEFITDAKGRKLYLKEISPGAMLDLIEAAGNSAGNNSAWLRFAQVCCSVKQIDETPVPMPTNKVQIKALADRLGNDGFAAAAVALYPDVTADTHAEEAEAVKN